MVQLLELCQLDLCNTETKTQTVKFRAESICIQVCMLISRLHNAQSSGEISLRNSICTHVSHMYQNVHSVFFTFQSSVLYDTFVGRIAAYKICVSVFIFGCTKYTPLLMSFLNHLVCMLITEEKLTSHQQVIF